MTAALIHDRRSIGGGFCGRCTRAQLDVGEPDRMATQVPEQCQPGDWPPSYVLPWVASCANGFAAKVTESAHDAERRFVWGCSLTMLGTARLHIRVMSLLRYMSTESAINTRLILR